MENFHISSIYFQVLLRLPGFFPISIPIYNIFVFRFLVSIVNNNNILYKNLYISLIYSTPSSGPFAPKISSLWTKHFHWDLNPNETLFSWSEMRIVFWIIIRIYREVYGDIIPHFGYHCPERSSLLFNHVEWKIIHRDGNISEYY